jgi:LCP family protein required for cell wall assembly
MRDAHSPSSKRGRPGRAVVVAFAVVLVLVAAGAAGLWAYERHLNSELRRTDVFARLPSNRPNAVAPGAENLLLLGSDSRDPATATSSRTDTIMLLHLDANHRHAYVISIPRDTWVYVPTAPDGRNGGTMAKINAAFAWGGTPLVVQTVERFTGVPVDHVVLIDFAGFRQVVDALGGVDMNVDQTITSIFAPHRTYTKGMRHFTGSEALDYVRQRYQFPDGDFTRERHQRAFLKAMLDKAAGSGTLTNPFRLNSFLRALTASVTVDKSFDLFDTALALRSLRSHDVTFLPSPSSRTAREGNESVVLPQARDKALYRAVANDTVAAWVAASR